MSSIWEVEASDSSGSSEVPSEGNHPAVLVGLVDLGTHEEDYQGKKYNARKILLCWELVAEHKSDGTPFIVAQSYNLMAKVGAKAGLRKLLEGWRGKPMADGEKLNLASLVGKPCLINIGHGKSAKGNEYAKILGVTPLVKGMSIPKPANEGFLYEITSDPKEIPEWVPYLFGQPIVDIIEESREKGGARQPVGAGVNGATTADEDSIPF